MPRTFSSSPRSQSPLDHNHGGALDRPYRTITMASADRTLHEATALGDEAAVAALHANGTDLEARDAGSGRTAMTIAAARCDARMTELLFALGADPGAADGTHTHPIYVAATATTPPLRDQLATVLLLSQWGGVDLDAEHDDLGTALEHLLARVPPPHHAERVGAVVRLLLLRGAWLYRGSVTCRPVRDELLRRIRSWLATQGALHTFLAACRYGVTTDIEAAPARALTNTPMVRRLIGAFVPVLTSLECARLRHATYTLQESVDDEMHYAETHAFAHVNCHAM